MGRHSLWVGHSGYRFNAIHATDDYGAQRGLEQRLYEQFPGAQLANGGLNRIRPVSPTNRWILEYTDAAEWFLRGP